MGLNDIVAGNWASAIELYNGLSSEDRIEFKEKFPTYADRVELRWKERREITETTKLPTPDAY